MNADARALTPAVARERARCVAISRFHLVTRDLPLAMAILDSGVSIEAAFQRFWGAASPKQREGLLVARAELSAGNNAN